MATLKLPKLLARDLTEVLAPCSDWVEDFAVDLAVYGVTELVENRPTGDKTRRTLSYEIVVKTADGRHWATVYERSPSEYQETEPFECVGSEVDFWEVERVEVTTYTYKRAADVRANATPTQ